MITPITATFPALNFPKEVDYPTQEDWAAFSANAELNYGILSGTWSDKSEEFKEQTNNLALEIQEIGENAFNAISLDTIEDLATYTGTGLVMVKDINRGGTFVSKTAMEIDPNTGSLYTRNDGTVFAKLGGGFWVRQYSGAVNVKWFGANEARNDNEVPIQLAINNYKSVLIPSGEFKISSPIVLSQNIFSIEGIKGKSILMGTSVDIEGYFRIEGNFVSDFGVIKNITFDSNDSTKNRTAIYAVSPYYIIHWKIEECNFNGRLTGGIEGNLIACHIFRCYFGVYFTADPNNLVAIKSVGSASAVKTTNINIIEQCEFAKCGNPENIVEFETGYKVVFRDCIFEALHPNLSVIKMVGIKYPVLEGCWFENCNGEVTSGKCVIYTGTDTNSIFCEVLTVSDCLFHTFNNIPEGLINMSNSIRKVIEFNKNQITALQSPVIVGGNSIATFVSTYGNSATVGAGGDATDLQYNSNALFGLGVKTPIVTSNGIKFPATQVLSTNTNTLDDYKESIWNITDGSGAGLSLTAYGKYTKVGNVVIYSGYITYPITADVSSARISQPPVFAYTEFPSIVSSDSGLAIQAFGDNTNIKFYKNNTFTVATNAELSGKRLFVGGSYISAV